MAGPAVLSGKRPGRQTTEELAPKPHICGWEVVPPSPAAVSPALGHSQLPPGLALAPGFPHSSSSGSSEAGRCSGVGQRKPVTDRHSAGVGGSGSGLCGPPDSLLQSVECVHVCASVHACALRGRPGENHMCDWPEPDVPVGKANSCVRRTRVPASLREEDPLSLHLSCLWVLVAGGGGPRGHG